MAFECDARHNMKSSVRKDFAIFGPKKHSAFDELLFILDLSLEVLNVANAQSMVEEV